MKFMSVILVVLSVMAGSSVVLAQNQSVAPACTDCYDYNTKPWDKTKVRRDQTGQAGVIRDYVVADYALTLTLSVRELNEKAGPSATPAERDKAVEQAGKEARKQSMPPGLNKRQKRQVKAMMDERDRAIIAAGTGDMVGLAAAVRELDRQVEAIQQEIEALKENDAKQDGAIADLEARIDALKASEATDPDIDQKLEQMKDDLTTAASVDKKALVWRIEELEKLVARVEALEDSNDSAEIDNLRSRMEQVVTELDEVSETAKTADEKADKALDKAEEALALANQKMDAGLLEVGFEGFFSPAIKAGLVEGAYVITKWRLRLALGGAIGGTFEKPDDTKFVFDTRLRLYFAVSPEYFWVGGFATMYGEGLPTNDQFGYGGGLVARGMVPLGGSGFSLGLEGFVGGASEYSWVDNTSGIANAEPGQIVDEHVLEPNPVIFGGFGIILTR